MFLSIDGGRSWVYSYDLSVEVGSGAVTCAMSLDLASQLKWDLMLPYVLWIRTSPLGWGGLRCCLVSHSSLRVTCFKHKEKPSRPACVASHACSQRTHTCL
jgi:hypothetical protein